MNWNKVKEEIKKALMDYEWLVSTIALLIMLIIVLWYWLG